MMDKFNDLADRPGFVSLALGIIGAICAFFGGMFRIRDTKRGIGNAFEEAKNNLLK